MDNLRLFELFRTVWQLSTSKLLTCQIASAVTQHFSHVDPLYVVLVEFNFFCVSLTMFANNMLSNKSISCTYFVAAFKAIVISSA